MTIIFNDAVPRGLGYVEIDQRPVEAALPPGTVRHFEADTYTCSHCERVVIVNPLRLRPRYKCKGCSHHVCDECASKVAAGEKCRTYAQFIEEQREKVERQTNSGLILLP